MSLVEGRAAPRHLVNHSCVMENCLRGELACNQITRDSIRFEIHVQYFLPFFFSHVFFHFFLLYQQIYIE